MNNLIWIFCKLCGGGQKWEGSQKCAHCRERMSNYSIAVQVFEWQSKRKEAEKIPHAA